MVGLTAVVTVGYSLTLIPFKSLQLVPGIASIRPAGALPIVFSLLFGPAAAWGSMFGNVVGDLVGNTWTQASYFGAAANFVFGYVGYHLWGNLGRLSSGERPTLRTSSQLIEYAVVVVVTASLVAAIIGWGTEVTGLFPFSVLGVSVVLNNILAGLLLGPPLLYVAYPVADRHDLLYIDVMPGRALSDHSPERCHRVAVGLTVVAVSWLVAGLLVSTLLDGVSLTAGPGPSTVDRGGSPLQVGIGVVGALFVGVFTVTSGDRMAALEVATGDPLDRSPPDWHLGAVTTAVIGAVLAALYFVVLRVTGEAHGWFPDSAGQLVFGLALPTLLIGGTLWLTIADEPSAASLQVPIWTLSGMVALTVLTGWQFYFPAAATGAGESPLTLLSNAQAGAVVGFLVGVYDARAKRRQTELEAARNHLAERNQELESTKRELERSNEKLEQFAGVVSHDLRNPLTVVRGRFEFVRDDLPSEHADPIADNLDRMESMIDDLLTLSRVGSGIEDTEPVSLGAVAADSWNEVRADDAELEITTPDHVTVEADADRLQHIFENLFRNAREHNDTAVTVRVGTLPDDSETETDRVSGFFVEDDGEGLPADDDEEIFEHGYTTSDGGTGFGLSIVEEVATAHGWTVSASEGRDGGARFEIRMDGGG
jgi:signal transduction histidine kinase